MMMGDTATGTSKATVERAAAEELALREEQRRADADDGVDGHGDQRDLGRELQGGERVGFVTSTPEGAGSRC